jgi:hypothetical protein
LGIDDREDAGQRNAEAANTSGNGATVVSP